MTRHVDDYVDHPQPTPLPPTPSITMLEEGAGLKALIAHLFGVAALVPDSHVALVYPRDAGHLAHRDALAWVDAHASAVRQISWPIRRVTMANAARLTMLSVPAAGFDPTGWGGYEFDVVGFAALGRLEPLAVEFLKYRQRSTRDTDAELGANPRLIGTIAL